MIPITEISLISKISLNTHAQAKPEEVARQNVR
jgi:hypothetical protein